MDPWRELTGIEIEQILQDIGKLMIEWVPPGYAYTLVLHPLSSVEGSKADAWMISTARDEDVALKQFQRFIDLKRNRDKQSADTPSNT